MHFKSQRVDARVDHAIATIDITQVFLNELETPVEATYQIPIDQDKNVVVAGLLFQIGEKMVESKIQEKNKAKEKYDDAISAGNAAVYGEDSEDEKFLKMTIGGIQSMQEVTVKLQIIKKLSIEEGSFALRIPVTYFINFGNGLSAETESLYSFRISINT